MRTVPSTTTLLLIFHLAVGAGVRAQDREGQPPPVLTPGERARLAEVVRPWFAAELELARTEGQPRRASADRKGAALTLRQQVENARRSCEDAFARAARTVRTPNLLRHLADLDGIFAAGFPFEPKDGGVFTTRTVRVEREAVEVGLWLPRLYAPQTAQPLVLSLPPRAGTRGWLDGRSHLTSLWGNTQLLEQAVLAAPGFPKDLVLDQPEGQGPRDERQERLRVGFVLTPLTELLTEIHVDTNRVVLECGRDNCVAALRIASYFPHRFAGVVVRDPTDLGSIVPDNLRSLPILLVVGRESERHADEFLARVQAAGGQQASKRRGRGDAPFVADNEEIAAWILERVRNPFPRQVSLVPLSNRPAQSFWLTVLQCDPVATAIPQGRPRLDAVVDREQNTFLVTARGVQQFSLLVNDALLDLDREILVVVNGEPLWRGKKARSLEDLGTWMLRGRDPHWIYVREIGSLSPSPGARAAVVSEATAARVMRFDATPWSGEPDGSTDRDTRGGEASSAERPARPGPPPEAAPESPAEVPEPASRLVREDARIEEPEIDDPPPTADVGLVFSPGLLTVLPLAVLMGLALVLFLLRARSERAPPDQK